MLCVSHSWTSQNKNENVKIAKNDNIEVLLKLVAGLRNRFLNYLKYVQQVYTTLSKNCKSTKTIVET